MISGLKTKTSVCLRNGPARRGSKPFVPDFLKVTTGLKKTLKNPEVDPSRRHLARSLDQAVQATGKIADCQASPQQEEFMRSHLMTAITSR